MEIKLNEGRLFYSKTVGGKKSLLLFHGYGQDHSVFNELTESISEDYTCYSFDLFFHGKSTLENAEPHLSVERWKQFLGEFLVTEKISDFSILGYSIGARLVLSTVEAFPGKVNKVFFVAPDGIKNNWWYTFATSPAIRFLFKGTITRPWLFLSTISVARKLNLVHPNVLRFAASQMSTQEKRRKVYNTWIALYHLKTDIQRIALALNERNTEVVFVMASFDQVITEDLIREFGATLKNKTIITLQTGHSKLLHLIEEKPELVFRDLYDNRR